MGKVVMDTQAFLKIRAMPTLPPFVVAFAASDWQIQLGEHYSIGRFLVL